MKRVALGAVLIAALLIGVVAYHQLRSSAPLILTGLVTTDEIIVSSQVAGRISRLLVAEGDPVKGGQLLAEIAPEELRAESEYYAYSARGQASQVKESEAALRLQEQQTTDQIRQAEAALASIEAQQAAAVADVENARLVFERSQQLRKEGIVSAGEFDRARTSYDAARAQVEALLKQADGARAAVALARANAEQVSMRRHDLQARQQAQAAADAQSARADVRLAYTELHAPIDGVVDVRAARAGEVVAPGQPVLTLINPDDVWVRADVEETYIDRIRIGDRLTVRLPSGVDREGTVFYRGVDAGFATQRDVSRFKRDIKTFEIRLRMDNTDRRLAVGMTAYVSLPLSGHEGEDTATANAAEHHAGG